MKLTGPYILTLTGDTAAFARAGGRDRGILKHILERLFNGEESSVGELEYWGITITSGEGVVDRSTVRAATLDDAESVLADLAVSDPLSPEDGLAIYNILLDRVIGEEG